MLVADAGCWCWLLLLVAAADCCCWLLLLVAAAGCCCWLLLLVAAAGCCCWLLLLVARKIFEYFRDIGDLRLRQICRRKSLWIFSGCCWKVVEYFQVVDEKSLNISRILMRGRWKRVSSGGSRVVDEGKRMNKNGRALGFYTRVAAYSFSFGESQYDHLVRNREQVSWFCKQQNLRLRQVLKLS